VSLNEFSDEMDAKWMKLALEQASNAAVSGEVPVGAVLVGREGVMASDHNRSIQNCDPTAHAEVLVLRAGASKLKNYRLLDTTLYVTLEPCAMCAGALIWARVARLVFGAFDPKSGSVSSVSSLLRAERSNHQVQWQGGFMKLESHSLLKNFFAGKRKLQKYSG